MSTKLIVTDTLAGILAVESYIEDKEFLAFDIETTGLTSRHEVIGFSVCGSEDEAHYVILASWNATDQKLIYADSSVKYAALALLEKLKSKKLIMHNGIFDCSMIEANFKISLIDSLHTDTMVAAHLLDENRRIALKELATQYFGEDSKDEQKAMEASVIANGGQLTLDNYELYKGDARLIGLYGAKDTILTYKLFLNLVPELYEQGLDKFFYEDECMPLLRGPTYELNTTGLAVNEQALATLKKTLEAECLEAKDFIYQEIATHINEKYPGTNKKNTFNIGASQQLSWLLFGKLGLEFSALTDGGKTACRALNIKLPYTFSAKRDFIIRCEREVGSIIQPEATVNGKKVRAKKLKQPWAYIAVDKKTLAKLAPKFKWVEKLLEYQKKMKILNTYISGIEEGTEYGIIHPSFKQTGTTSGRYSSSNPNYQNLPRDDKRVKACMVPRPGKVFVGADQSQLEPRIFSYYSEDERLMAAFDGTSDFYSVVGMGVYDKTDCTPQKEGSPEAFGVKYKHLRDLSKVIALARAYGATAHQLAPTTGKSIEATQADIDRYDEEFPGVLKMMLDAHKLAKEQGFVTNLFGRPRRMPEAKRITKLYGDIPHGELPYEARSLLNLACNHRIQSTGASIMNRAAIRLHKLKQEAGIDARLVCQVHDSMIIECDEADAENVAILLQESLENTIQLKGIAFEAIPRIGRNLSEV